MFSKDFKEFIKLLNENNAKYLVVGGYAVSIHGYPRYTGDIDIYIDMTKKNALILLDVLKQFGFNDIGITEKDLLEPDNIIQLGYPPHRIDIINSMRWCNL
ncbi:MAG: hypothetical protein SCALA702_17930 [Melioribacteraceae bacterium]|nr:MAG: hypothetical protein SCALA702_17930 [Melioribacteraceae bacterium]